MKNPNASQRRFNDLLGDLVALSLEVELYSVRNTSFLDHHTSCACPWGRWLSVYFKVFFKSVSTKCYSRSVVESLSYGA